MKFSFLTQEDDQFTKSIAKESRDHVQQLYSRLGNEMTLNSLASLSYSQKPKQDEKFVKFETTEKVEKFSPNNITRSESLSYFEQTNSISGETTSTDMLDESTKMKLTLAPPLHNDFYNKFNQELFDDDDLN